MHVAHAIKSRFLTSSNRINPTRQNASANARRKSFETVALVGGLNIFRDGSTGGGLGGRAMKIGRRPQQQQLARLACCQKPYSVHSPCAHKLSAQRTQTLEWDLTMPQKWEKGKKRASGTLSQCKICEQKTGVKYAPIFF